MSVVDFDVLRKLLASGSSGIVDAQTQLRSALFEIEWVLSHRASPPLRAVEKNAPEALLDVEGAARFLGMSPSWVYHHAAKLPHQRVGGKRLDDGTVSGGKLRFVASELERHMKNGGTS